MVIEHSFVTTLEGADVLHLAAGFLQARGFSSGQPPALSSAGAPESLEMHRGKSNAARAQSVADLPQSLRLEFDRGRVNLAASITPSAAWGGRSFTSSEIGLRPADTSNPKRLKMHADLLMGIVTGLELLLVQRAPSEIAVQKWTAIEEQIAAAARQRKRRNRIALTLLGLFIVSIIGVIVYAVRKS